MPSPKLTHAKVHHLQRLLNMQYKPAEIAEELSITVDTVYRSYLPAGAPHTVDGNGNIWIVGTAFHQWAKDYLTTNQRKPKTSMEEDQGFCLRCNQVVTVSDFQMTGRNSRGVGNMVGTCSGCGNKVFRLVKKGAQ